MVRSLDEQRYRKTYSFYRSQPQFRQDTGSGGNNSALLALDWKESVRLASDVNISLAGTTPLMIDGLELFNGESVLLTKQYDCTENGIYFATISGGTYSLQRSGDADQDTLSCGAIVFSTDGYKLAGTMWAMITPDPITIGSSDLNWIPYINSQTARMFEFDGYRAKSDYLVSFDSERRYAGDIGGDVCFFVSSSLDGERKVVLGGDVHISGSLSNGGGISLGLASHADGLNFSLGERAHSEGKETLTLGYSSHAEGIGTMAAALESHAEGFYSRSGGELYLFSVDPGGTVLTIYERDATSLGLYDTVVQVVTFNEVFVNRIQTVVYSSIQYIDGNTIINLYEPIDTTSVGGIVFSEAIGKFSHAEGKRTIALGESSHSEGDLSEARGLCSHAEGTLTIARGRSSHTEGNACETTEDAHYSHAGGNGTIASGLGQTAIGSYNLEGNTESLFVIGNGTDVTDRSDVLRVERSGLQISGSFSLSGSFNIEKGSNLPTNTVNLSGGSPSIIIVENSLAKTSSIIMLTKQSFNSPGSVGISSKSDGSFTITSSVDGDIDEVAYFIINP